MWGLLRQFPTMEPFGPAWFGVLREVNHPLSELRMRWIFENQLLDRDEAIEQRYVEVEYGGMFSNFELWRKVQESKSGEKAAVASQEAAGQPIIPAGGFRIIQDVTPFWEMYNEAQGGALDLGETPQELLDELEEIRATSPPLRQPRDIVALDGGIVSAPGIPEDPNG